VWRAPAPHCHAVLADTSGQVLGIGANQDPANWDDVGIEAAAGAIRSCVREALNDPPAVGAVLMAIDTTADAQSSGLRRSLAEGVATALGHTERAPKRG
jgi:N-acetylglucosamine kinase-like BadF-type ATPase